MSQELRMPDINTIMLAGNLTRDPELTYTAGGMALCKFGIAVNKRYTTKSGEQREETLFMNVTVWGKSAEWCGENIHKGSPVIVSGRMTQNDWTTNGGDKRTSYEVNADRVQAISWGTHPRKMDDANTPGAYTFEKDDEPKQGGRIPF